MPPPNSELFDETIASGDLPVRAGLLFASQPGAGPINWDRVEGMLLGVAIGDALGNTSEGALPSERAREHGEVTDYLPNWKTGGERKGTPSDDSQLTFWTVEHLVEHGGFDLDMLGATFASRRVFGVGSTLLDFCSGIRQGETWQQAAPKSAGNGALMRIVPALLPHVRQPTPAIWRDAALLARLTHNDCASTASCLAFVALLWELGAMEGPPAPSWWSEAFVATLKDVDRGDAYAPRGGAYTATGSFAALVETRLSDARRGRWSARVACDRFRSGAYVLETVPCVLHILTMHGHDPEEAIVRAVNDTKDNDTIAAIVGAAMGMLHGADALPRRWRQGLTGRTASDDDGRIFALIDQARARFWAE